MIFMVLNFVLENYFKDILSLVDQSSDIGDKILDCWFLSFNFFFLWIIQIKQTFIAYDFGALHLCFHMLVCLDLCFMPSSMCLCAPCHACVPRPRLVCHAKCYYSRFVSFIAFSCVLAFWFGLDLGLMVFVIVHTTWPISKGLDHPFFMCILDCFYVLCLC